MAAIRQISALFIFMALCHFGHSNPTKEETNELSELVKNIFHPFDFEKLVESLGPQQQSNCDKSKSDYLEPSNQLELENSMAKESLESDEFLSHLINYKKKNPNKKYKKDKANSYEPREYNKKPTSTHKHKKSKKLNSKYIKEKDSNYSKNAKQNIPTDFPSASELSLKGEDDSKDKSSDQSDYNDSSAIKVDKTFYEMNRPSVPATKKIENKDEYINEIRNEILQNIIENLSKQLHKGNVNTEAPTPNSSSASMFDSYYIPKGPATVSVRHNGATKDTYGYEDFDGYTLDEKYPPIAFYDPISGKQKYLIQLSNGKIAVVPGTLLQSNKHETNYKNDYYKKMFKNVPKDIAYERPGVKRNNQPVKLLEPNPYIYSLPYVAHSTDDTSFLTAYKDKQLSLPENKNDDKNKMDENKEDKNKMDENKGDKNKEDKNKNIKYD